MVINGFDTKLVKAGSLLYIEAACTFEAKDYRQNVTITDNFPYNMFETTLMGQLRVGHVTVGTCGGCIIGKRFSFNADPYGNAHTVLFSGMGVINPASQYSISQQPIQIPGISGLSIFMHNRIVIVSYAEYTEISGWGNKLIASDLPKPISKIHSVAVAQNMANQTVIAELLLNGNLSIVNKNDNAINTWVFFNLSYFIA